MKISVITICKNEANCLKETIESVLSQDYEDIEYVIIDGGSTDNTSNVIEEYKDKIAYFISEPDDGIYNAMNKGIKAATGEVVIFMNATDKYYSNDAISSTMKIFKKTNAEMIYGNAIIKEHDSIKSIKKTKIRNKLYFIYGSICHQSTFYKKELFEKIGLYDESYRIYGDTDFHTRILLNKTKIRHIDKIISVFSIGGTSSTIGDERKLFNEEYIRCINSHYSANEILLGTFIKALRSFLIRNLNQKWLAYMISGINFSKY